MDITVARFYHPAGWNWLYSYRVAMVTIRIVELAFIALRFLFFRAPLLVVWTRLPGLRNTRPPYRELGEILAPYGQRASLSIGMGQLGSSIALTEDIEEMSKLQAAFLDQKKPPKKIWSVTGCVIRGLVTELGAPFIKLGQIMSMREELPPSVRDELALLQDKLPPMSYKQVKKTLERELDRPLEEVFEWVEETPIAAASLAQVHRAKLLREQEEVALKIQRPYLQGTVALDSVIICSIMFGTIRRLLPLLNKVTDVSVFTVSFRKSLKKEIDFVLEGRSQDWCRQFAETHPVYGDYTKIAKTYRDYTTNKLLTMEYVRGLHRLDRVLDELTPEQLFELASLKVKGFPPELPIQLIWVQARMAMEAWARYGCWSADLHLGNVYIMEPECSGGNWRAFLCDFGMMLEMDDNERQVYLDFMSGIAYYYDGRRMADGFAKIGSRRGEVPQATVDNLDDQFKTLVTRYMIPEKEGAERTMAARLQRGTTINVMSEATYRLCATGVKMPDFLWLFFKTVSYYLNIVLTYYNTPSFSEMVSPQIRQWVKDKTFELVDTKDITNLRDCLPEVLSELREHDRKEVLNYLATGEVVTPLEQRWQHDWVDRRFGF